MSQLQGRTQRFDQQSYSGPSEPNCENYFGLHPVLEMLSLLSKMVFGTSSLEKREDVPSKPPPGLEEFPELRSPRQATGRFREARPQNSSFEGAAVKRPTCFSFS